MIEVLRATFVEPIGELYFQKALVGGCLVAIVCGVVGCFVILRRMSFLGDGLAHAMLAGIAGGYLVMQGLGYEAHAPAMLLGSVLAALLTVGMIGFVSRASRIKEDAAIGIMYTGAFALGGLLVSVFSDRIHIDLVHFVLGDVLAVSDGDLWISGTIAAVVLSVVILFYRQLQLTSFDPIMATSIGVPVLAMDYLLTTCTSLVVVSAVNMVGVILAVGLMITPAATAYLLCDRLHRMILLSALFGLTSVVGGLYAAVWLNTSGAPPIVLMSVLQFLVVLAFARRYGLLAGWLRRRRAVPQELMEKILRSVLRGEGEPVRLTGVLQEVQQPEDGVRRVIRAMQRRGLAEFENQELSLTPAGYQEARRILRAHRLWETYLAHVGEQPAKLHERAEQLQHLHDEASVDYLDDKLEHPLRDPHGAEIPEDFVHLVPGNTVHSSLLREGYEATVTDVGPRLADTPLAPGMRITMGPRRDRDTRWTLILPDGSECLLDHDEADALTVEVARLPSGKGQ